MQACMAAAMEVATDARGRADGCHSAWPLAGCSRAACAPAVWTLQTFEYKFLAGRTPSNPLHRLCTTLQSSCTRLRLRR